MRETEPSDTQLLNLFIEKESDKAFTDLVERYNGMVRSVCKSVLYQDHDVEDAVQASFLILAQKAATIKERQSIAPFLYKVARCAALDFNRADRRRKQREKEVAHMTRLTTEESGHTGEYKSLIQEELQLLPKKYQQALIIRYFQDHTSAEAAELIQCKAATFRTRLARAQTLLQKRLQKRGLSITVIILGTLLTNTIHAAPLTKDAALTLAHSLLDKGHIPTQVASASGAVSKMLAWQSIKTWAAGLTFAAVLLSGGILSLSLSETPTVSEKNRTINASQTPELTKSHTPAFSLIQTHTLPFTPKYPNFLVLWNTQETACYYSVLQNNNMHLSLDIYRYTIAENESEHIASLTSPILHSAGQYRHISMLADNSIMAWLGKEIIRIYPNNTRKTYTVPETIYYLSSSHDKQHFLFILQNSSAQYGYASDERIHKWHPGADIDWHLELAATASNSPPKTLNHTYPLFFTGGHSLTFDNKLFTIQNNKGQVINSFYLNNDTIDFASLRIHAISHNGAYALLSDKNECFILNIGTQKTSPSSPALLTALENEMRPLILPDVQQIIMYSLSQNHRDRGQVLAFNFLGDSLLLPETKTYANNYSLHVQGISGTYASQAATLFTYGPVDKNNNTYNLFLYQNSANGILIHQSDLYENRAQNAQPSPSGQYLLYTVNKSLNIGVLK